MGKQKPVTSLRPPPTAAAFVALGDAPGATPLEPNSPLSSVAALPVNPLAVPPASPSTGQPVSPPAGQRASGRKLQRRADGRGVRKQTVYLPAELSRRLAVYCAETGKDQSEVISELLSSKLFAASR